MKFGPTPITDAVGCVLAHNVVDERGRRVLRKGRRLDQQDIETLRTLGRRTITVARLERDDVDEDTAALRLTERHVAGAVRLSGPSTGRVNVHAEALGVVRVHADRLLELNRVEGVTLSVLDDGCVVQPERMVGTTKILPYALPGPVIEAAAGLAGPCLEVVPLPCRDVHLIVTAGEGSRDRTLSSFQAALGQRLDALGSRLVSAETVSSDIGTEEQLAEALERCHAAGADLIVIAGETAIQDRDDFAPEALRRAGGVVLCYGAPVDPGNLLLLGELRAVPVVGAPGCARSPKRNIVDLVLPRLLIGDRLEREDILRWGHGGLLADVGERPLPRRQISARASSEDL